MRKIGSSLSFLALFLVLSLYPAVRASSWASNAYVHSLLELISSLLAMTAGAMILLHFLSTGRWFYLIISIGFVQVGGEELVHAAFSSLGLSSELPAGVRLAVSTTWLTGKGFLVAAFVTALFFQERETAPDRRRRIALTLHSVGFVCSALVATLIFISPFLPEFVRLGSTTKRLTELSLALLFLAVSLMYARVYLKQQQPRSPLLWSITACIILQVSVHVFVFDSQHFYDAQWDAAHLLVLLSYFFPIFGMWVEIAALHTAARSQVVRLAEEIAWRKRAEQDRQENEERLRMTAEAGNVGLWDWNLRTNRVHYSAVWKRQIGYGDHEISDDFGEWQNHVHPDDLDGALARVRMFLDAPYPNFENEFRFRHKNGSYRTILARASLHYAEDGKPDRMLGAHLDITERVKTLAALVTVQKLESLGTLAGGIAHDFNNILTAVVGNLSLLRSESRLGDEARELLTEALDACGTAKSLAHQLLAFARGGAPVAKVLDLRPVLTQSAGFAARGSNARCVFDLGESPLAVNIDKDQVAQVVQNLVINASQAMPRGGDITVRATTVTLHADEQPPLVAGRYVQVSVEDQGTGIPPEHLSSIFDPYFSTKAMGRGLGLAVCYSIMAKHGGQISVESKLGEGTVFSLHFPAADAAELQREHQLTASLTEGRGRILVMDDEPLVLTFLERALSRLGYQVESVGDGKAALDAYGKAVQAGEPYDVVIMDLTIRGGMGGRETMGQLRALYPEAKAIVSSGYDNDAVMSDFAAFGFSAVLAKPYRIEEVSEILRRIIPSRV